MIARIFDEDEGYELGLPDPVSLSPQNRKLIRALGRRYEQMFANIVRSGIDQKAFIPVIRN